MSAQLSVNNLITEHLDTWTQAIETKSTAGRGSSNKLNLVGIQKLRELILEMAVRGLLVPQDPNDEPASVLLEKIAAEKAQLIKEGKIKKTKALPEIAEDEKPFDLPSGWEWIRLNDAYDVRDGTHDSPKAQQSGYPLVTSKNLSSGKLDLTDIKYISEQDHLKIQDRSKVDLGDILFAMIGSIGNPVIVDIPDEFSIKNVALFKYYRADLASPKYLKNFLEHASVEMKENAAGGVQSFVSLSFLRTFVIALPPLEEQKRIVVKVDELMALCDQLENETLNHIDTHQTLVSTLLGNLVNPENTANFHQAWSLIAQNFDVLFTTENSIHQLKQTILQLAVMGKLVPQNPNDEPASELLKKIAAEKAQLIADKKIKKSKPLPAITDDEKPFDLPNGWEWVRLQEPTVYVQRGKGPKYADSGKVRVISQKCVQWSGFDISVARYVEDSSLEKYQEERFLQKNDLLWNSTGTGTVGRVNVLSDISEQLVADSHVTVIRPLKSDSNFIKCYLSSGAIQRRIEPDSENPLVSGSTKQVELNTSSVNSLPIPIAPLEEQKRIVAKVNELMTLCDQLKTRLQTAETTQCHLAQSIAQEALG